MSIQDYTLNEIISRGAYGQVFLVFDKKDKVYALKVMMRTAVKEEDVEREAILQARAQHANVVRLMKFFVDETKYYLVMQYMPGGSLTSFLKKNTDPLSEIDAKKIISQILIGVSHIHGLSILHRDLKPCNMLVGQNGIIKIGDFGSATEVEDGKPVTGYVGTRGFMAPEILDLRPYGYSADMFSMGVSILEIVCQKMIGQCPAAELPGFIPENASPDLRSLLVSVLQIDAPSRPTAADLLHHNWFAE